MYAMISHNDAGYAALAQLTWHQNKVDYAAIHGYAVWNKTEDWITSNGRGAMGGFEKIYMTQSILEEYPEVEWVWWTGTDSMITNFSVKIEDRVDNNYHVILNVDANGINADSFLVRNTEQGRAFIQDALNQESVCSQYWDTEQRAFCYVLGFPATGEHGWPTGDKLVVPEKYRDVVKIVPQRHMNSYNYSIYHCTHIDKSGNDGNWQPGDWLIHWPGCSQEARMLLHDKYVTQIVGKP